MKARQTIYHPNGKGTGSALRLELRPADGDIEGYIEFRIAPQLGLTTVHAFDWPNAISARLYMTDLAHVMNVLRGCEESICDGKGLYCLTISYSMIVKFEHRIEPVPGYLLEFFKRPHDGEERRVRFFFSRTEAVALSLLIEQSLVYVVFGDPLATNW